MAATGTRLEAARGRTAAAIREYACAIREAQGVELGEGLIHTRELKDQLEAVFVEALGRFDKSGDYAADGAVDLVAWVRSKCKYSGAAAAERVGMARQLAKLPQTRTAFATGELAFQHAAVLARTAEQVGAAAVRKAEGSLLRLAETMDPGQFTGIAKNFAHTVDAGAAQAGANRAHGRRYLNISEPMDGMVRLDGLLDAEGGAIVRHAITSGAPPSKGDERTPGQRRADRLLELCLPRSGASKDGSGPRPHLIVRATVETLVGATGAPGGELDGGVVVPAESVRRIACDAAISRIVGRGDLDAEITRAGRTIPPAMRRALATRDRGCVIEGCNRPPQWTDVHHIRHWADGGPTTMDNVVLLCKTHHRKTHDEGRALVRGAKGQWRLTPPLPSSRSA